MSSTRRRKRNRDQDVYPTPTWLIRLMMPHLQKYLREVRYDQRPLRILEPAAGAGQIVRCLRQHFDALTGSTLPRAVIHAAEVRPECEEALRKEGADEVFIGDFTAMEFPEPYDIVMTNPPYSLDLEYFERCREIIAPTGVSVLLYRVGFMESEDRGPRFVPDVPDMHVTTRRPTFVNDSSDSACYAWMGWLKEPRSEGRVFILPYVDKATVLASRAEFPTIRTEKVSVSIVVPPLDPEIAARVLVDEAAIRREGTVIHGQ